MAGFLYFLPDGFAQTPTEFGGARFKTGMASCAVTVGPDGKPGAVCMISGAKGECKYAPATQHWTRCARGFHLGINLGHHPQPAELRRPDAIGGHAVKLGGGNTWEIPLARLWMDGEPPTYTSAVPHSMGIGPDGKFQMQPSPEYTWLIQKAEEFWAMWATADKYCSLKFEDAWQVAVECLRHNYYVLAEEVSALALITTTNIWAVLKALIDWPGYERVANALAEARAKNAFAGTADSSDSISGVSDETPATGPRLRTSNSS